MAITSAAAKVRRDVSSSIRKTSRRNGENHDERYSSKAPGQQGSVRAYINRAEKLCSELLQFHLF